MNYHELNEMNPFDMHVKSMLIENYDRFELFDFSSTTFISGEDDRDLPNLRLADVEIVCTLGVGGFGRAELVKSS